MPAVLATVVEAGIIGAMNAAITKQNITKGALIGALTAGFSELLDVKLNNIDALKGSPNLQGALKSIATSGLDTALHGGNLIENMVTTIAANAVAEALAGSAADKKVATHTEIATHNLSHGFVTGASRALLSGQSISQSVVAGANQGLQAAVTGLAKHYGNEIAKQIPVQHVVQKNRQTILTEQAIMVQKEALTKAAAQYLQENNLNVPEGTIKATIEKHSVFKGNAADIEESLISLGCAAHEDNKNRHDAAQAIERGLAIVLRSTIKQLAFQTAANAKIKVENKSTTRNNSSNRSPNFVPQLNNQNFSQTHAGLNSKDEVQNNFVGDGQGPLLSKVGFQVSITPIINPLVKQAIPEPSVIEKGLMFMTGSNNSHANGVFATPLFNSSIVALPPQYVGNHSSSSSSYLPQILQESNNYPGREPGLEEYFAQKSQGPAPQPLAGNSTPGITPLYNQAKNNLKVQAKIAINEQAQAQLKTDNKCDVLRDVSVNELAQYFTDTGHDIFRTVQEQHPGFSVNRSTDGTYIHTSIRAVGESYERICGDERIRFEQSMLNDKPTPNNWNLPGSSRLDMITTQPGTNTVFEVKTGGAEVTENEGLSRLRNAPQDPLLNLYEQRISAEGGQIPIILSGQFVHPRMRRNK